jgi:antitoxin (DNA-binding transcriptional repressor) of toxin-antitoxin stability system
MGLCDTFLCITMKTITRTASVRDLRNNFAQVSLWLDAGQEVQITKRGEVMGTLVPAKQTKTKRPKWNAEERLKKLREMSGGKTLPGNSVLLMREGSNW